MLEYSLCRVYFIANLQRSLTISWEGLHLTFLSILPYLMTFIFHGRKSILRKYGIKQWSILLFLLYFLLHKLYQVSRWPFWLFQSKKILFQGDKIKSHSSVSITCSWAFTLCIYSIFYFHESPSFHHLKLLRSFDLNFL